MALRYAIIGTGMMGQEHIRNIALLEDATVTAIADPLESMRGSALQKAADHGMPEVCAFEDYRQLLAQDIADVIVVVSPNDTHFPVMADIMATGLPILLEKPAATTPQDAWALVDQAKGYGAPIWVAMEYRYMPPISRLIDAARAGTIGDSKMLSIVEHRFPFLVKPNNWNRFSARTGGTMVEKCCHFFDLMRHILRAEPVRVFGSGAQDVNHIGEVHDGRESDILDNGFVIVDFDNGARAALDLCMFAEGSYWQEHVSLVGDTGKIEAFVPGPSRFWPAEGERASQIVISPRGDKAPLREDIHVDEAVLAAGDHHGGTFYQHRNFADIIRQGGMPAIGLTDGAMAVEMGFAAELSMREKRVVEIAKR